MNLIIEFLIVSFAFWLVSNRMEGISMKKQETVFVASLIYMLSYALIKTLIGFLFKLLTLGMFSFSLLAVVLAAIGAMYVVTSTVKDYKIDSFPVLAAAVFVISVLAGILRAVFYFF